MGFVASPETQLLGKKTVYAPEIDDQQAPSFGEVVGAAFRQENIIGAFSTREVGLPDTKDDPSFDAYSMFTEEEKNDQAFVSTALYSDTEDELEATRKQMSRERQDRDTIARGGATGMIMSGAAGVMDPISLLSIGGVAVNTYRAGKGILSGAAVTGSVVAAETALVEAALHTQQLTRTFGESSINIGAGALLGGVLGGTVQLLPRYGIDETVVREMADIMEVEPKIAEGINPAINAKTGPIGEDSVGAARVVIGDVQVTGKAARFLTEKLGFDPLSRALTSKSPIVRRLAAELAESPIMLDNFTGQAVESLAKIKSGKLYNSIDNNNMLYDQYTKSGAPKMKRRDFNEAVARAIRTGESDIPEIKASSDFWRKELYDPLKNEMIELEMLPEDVDVSTSVNYLNRVYSSGKIDANYPQFITKVSGWLQKKDLDLYEQAKIAQEKLDGVDSSISAKGQTVYHRTTSDEFFEFDQLAEKSKPSFAGPEGIYFSPNKNDPSNKAFGANVIEAKVNVERPAPLMEIRSEIGGDPITLGRIDLFEIPSNLSGIKFLDEKGFTQTVDGVGYQAKTYSKKDLELMLKNKNLFKTVDPERLFPGDVKLLKESGYDGFSLKSAAGKPDQLVALSKDQVSIVSFNGKKPTSTPKTAITSAKEKADLQAIIDKAEYKSGRDFEAQDYDDIAAQIAQRIKGSPGGRLPYDWKMGEGTAKVGKVNALRGPLRNRTFQIDDEIIEEFLENDIEVLGARYLQQTAADIELTRQFGSVDMVDQIQAVNKEYRDRADGITDPKERAQLERERNADIRDLNGMRDRMRGVYGFQEDNIWTRIGRSSRDLNYLRLLGGVTISSFPDVARIVMAEGFAKTFSKGLAPLISNTKNFKIAASEAKSWGIGTDVLMAGKSDVIADVGDYVSGGTAVERALRSGANNFGKINFLDRWTSGMKQLHAVTMQTSIFDGLSKGKYDKRLGRLGIDKQAANDMMAQVVKHGKNEDGVWITGAKNWDRPDLERMWGVAMRKESDRVIIMPGQEKPLFMSSEMGKTIGQFRSFILSATQRVFIAGVQNQDHNTMGGIISLVGMGAFSYVIKQQLAGREVSEDPAVWITEGIDRSGVLGVVGEINNTIEKISSNSVGLRPLLGISAPASRFVSRSVSESILGPSLGSLLSTTVAASNALTSSGPMTDSDIRTLRRLIPLQNLSGVNKIFDEIETAIGDM